MSQARKNKNLLILILGSLTALSPFSIDMYLPAFQSVAEDLHTSVAQVSLTLSSYFIGISFGQLFYGPLLDRFGRKKPLYGGLILYILATLACLFVKSIENMVLLRFIQGIGGCAAGVAPFAMVRDHFTMRESSKVFSLLVLILGVSPLLAPTIGGAIATTYGWHAVFIVLAAIAVTLLIVSRFVLEESHIADKSVSLRPLSILRGFVEVIQVPQFYTYTLSGAIAFAGLFVYVAGSPVIFLEIFKVSPQVYSYIFAGLSVGFIGSSQVNILLIRHFSNEKIYITALLAQVAVGIVFLAGTLTASFGVIGTVTMLFLFLCTVGLTNPNGAALAMAPFSRNAGSASALMGFLQMGAGAIASTVVGLFATTDLTPIATIFFVSSSLALVSLLIGRKRILGPITDADSSAVLPSH